jgi:hypothetical protein
MQIIQSSFPEKSWIAEYLVVSDSQIQGKGVFTTKNIDKDTVVIVWGGVVVSIDEFRSGHGVKHTNVGIADDKFLVAPTDSEFSLDDYMNHSCDPNLWLKDAITLVSRRDIFSGEELTFDYAIELADESYIMKVECNCGSKLCRKVVTGRDWRQSSVQLAYQNHFSPFLNERIARLSRQKNTQEGIDTPREDHQKD